MAASVALLCGLFAIIFLVIRQVFMPPGKRRTKNGLLSKLPPGPPGLPIFGNLLAMAKGREDPDNNWLRGLTRYGEMATVHCGSKTMVFLNSNRVTAELINKYGSLTSERSRFPIASDIVSRGGRSLVLQTAEWTERRRVMHHLLNGSALQQYGEWQEFENTQMMAEVLFQPDQWHRHHFRYANSVLHRIALGERLLKSTKELADLQDVVVKFEHSIGASVVDWFPELARLPRPLQFWRPHWEKLGDWTNEVQKAWWLPVKKAVEDGTAPPSFARDVVLNPSSKFQGSDDHAMNVVMQLIEAGSDTSREALNIFVMAAIHYPKVIEKARKEVERVCCGKGILRYPLISDMEQMPYVCAMVKELLRWRPIFNTIPDHTLKVDLEFEGYRFPAGVGFMINEIAVSEECEEPDEFRPERWLNGHEAEIAHGLWQFGGGRRICVGYRLAQRGLFVSIARLLLCFDYEAAGTIDSRRLNHDISHREPFPVAVKVRSSGYRDLIVKQASAAGVLDIAKEIR